MILPCNIWELHYFLGVMNIQKRFAILCLSFLAAIGSASAQLGKTSPYEEALRQSVMDYRAGKVAEAAVSLEKAKAILDKMKSEQMGATLPDAPEGWEAEEMKTEDVGPLMGGGKVVKKIYKQKAGQQEILLEVYFGSSFIKLMRGLYTNDNIAKSQGFEIKRAGGENVLIKNLDAKNLEINMPFDDNCMVKLTGKDGAEEDTMLRLIKDIDRRTIKDLVK